MDSTSTPFRLRSNNYKACYRRFRLGSSVPQMEFFKHKGFLRTSVLKLLISLLRRIGYVTVSGNIILRKQIYRTISVKFIFIIWYFHFDLSFLSYHTLSLLVLLLELCLFTHYYCIFITAYYMSLTFSLFICFSLLHIVLFFLTAVGRTVSTSPTPICHTLPYYLLSFQLHVLYIFYNLYCCQFS